MPESLTAQINTLRRQQAAIAGFGSFALRQADLMTILTEAARVCAEGLSVPFCKVCRYRGEENDLLIEAGFGWHDGVVGHVVSRADKSSPQGRAFISGKPSICNDLREDNDFVLPPFYGEHGIVSTIDVVIKGDDQPYGILESTITSSMITTNTTSISSPALRIYSPKPFRRRHLQEPASHLFRPAPARSESAAARRPPPHAAP